MVRKESAVLIVDDDQAICEFIGSVLDEGGYLYDVATNYNDALNKLQNHHFDVALLDIKLPDRSGIDLLESSQHFFKTTSSIMITAVNDLDTAVKAIKLGALDYIVKPFSLDRLINSIIAAIEKNKGLQSNQENTEEYGDIEDFTDQSLRIMDTIAYGVEAQLDYYDFHSRIVTDKTIELARRFCIAEEDIHKWENIQNERFSTRNRYISSLIDKFERNAFAQIIFGFTKHVEIIRQKGGEQN